MALRNRRKNTGSDWQMKQKQVIEMLTDGEMASKDIAKALGISPSNINALMYQIPDEALLYEYRRNGETIYGRLKK